MINVVVNGDDLGLAPGVNAAIERAFRLGVLTSASLMTNMRAFDDALNGVIASNPGLGLGIHLVLTSGGCVSSRERVPLLVDSSGHFQHGFLGLWRLVSGPRASDVIAQIEHELRAQCEKALRLGIRVDHLDSHRHVHMIPAIWRLVVGIAADYRIPFVRLADEPWSADSPRRSPRVLARNLPKKIVLSRCARRNRAHLTRVGAEVRTADCVVGILDSDAITNQTLEAHFRHATNGITEIVVHPAFAWDEPVAGTTRPYAAMDARFVASPNRRLELEALMNPAVARIPAGRGVRLTSFGELAASAPRAA